MEITETPIEVATRWQFYEIVEYFINRAEIPKALYLYCYFGIAEDEKIKILFKNALKN